MLPAQGIALGMNTAANNALKGQKPQPNRTTHTVHHIQFCIIVKTPNTHHENSAFYDAHAGYSHIPRSYQLPTD